MRFIVQCPIVWGDRTLQAGDELDADPDDPQVAVLVSAGGLSGQEPVLPTRSGAP